MSDNLERKIEYVTPDTHQLEVRVAKIETGLGFIQQHLNSIENNVNTISNNLQSIRDQFSAHTGAATVKTRIWIVAYSCITVFLTLGLHTFIFKYLGINL